MGHSDLASYFAYSPNHYDGRKGYVVDTLTPHYMGGNCSVETCGNIFAPSSRQASSNYGIGSDGRIAVYVDEDDAAWTSGSWRNDCRAITFEVANFGDSSISNAAWESLVNLCVDIVRRYGFEGVQYTGSSDHSQQQDGYMLLTMHKWFQDTDCPGTYLSQQFDRLEQEVNAILESGNPVSYEPKNNTHGGELDVDGWAGYNTILDMQHALGTYEDGVVSGQWRGNSDYLWAVTSVEWGAQGSPMVKALQEMLGAGVDGLWGQETSRMLQEYLIDRGYDCGESGADGVFGNDSVRALQLCLNDGRFAR